MYKFSIKKTFPGFFFFFLFSSIKLSTLGILFKMNVQFHKDVSLKIYSCTQKQKRKQFSSKSDF